MSALGLPALLCQDETIGLSQRLRLVLAFGRTCARTGVRVVVQAEQLGELVHHGTAQLLRSTSVTALQWPSCDIMADADRDQLNRATRLDAQADAQMALR